MKIRPMIKNVVENETFSSYISSSDTSATIPVLSSVTAIKICPISITCLLPNLFVKIPERNDTIVITNPETTVI